MTSTVESDEATIAPTGPHSASSHNIDGIIFKSPDPERASISQGSFSPISSAARPPSFSSTELPSRMPNDKPAGGSSLWQSHPNPALICHPNHTLSLEPDSNVPGAVFGGSVLIHIKTTGLCGSDLHFWRDGAIGPLKVQSSYVLGHEAAGVVLAVGGGVNHLRPGDRVAIEPGVPCGWCWLCLEGRYNLCENVAFAGVWPFEGTCQRFKMHPARWCHKIPPTLTYAQGALLEPLCVVMHGVREAGVQMGRGVAIVGAGPIGLIALAVARASGAHPVVISDIEPRRLEFAATFVPHCRTYLVDRGLSSEQNAARMRDLFVDADADDDSPVSPDYCAPHVVLECTGTETGVGTAAFVARRGGTVMVIGVGKSSMNNLPFMHLSLAEIDLKFINRYRDLWPSAISALSGGIINLDALVTHVLPLEKAVEAMEISGDPTNGNIKVHVVDDIDILP